MGDAPKRIFTRPTKIRLAGGLLLLLSGAVAAEHDVPDHPALRDRFYFAAGAYFAEATSQAQLNSNRLGAGTNVDFEDALGLDRSVTVPTFFARMRLGERWRVEAEYFQIKRQGDRVEDQQIRWGNFTFPVNTRVQSAYDFSDLRMSAGYSFFKTQDKELGVGLGAHVASYKVSLTGTLNGSTVGQETESATAPLPVASVYAQMALTERWAVSGRYDRFTVKYSNYKGTLNALGLDLLYQPFRHIGIGLGIRDLFISVDADLGQQTLKVRQEFQGPVAYINMSF